MDKILCIGIGNRYRGDDGAGVAVAQQLSARVDAGIECVESSGEAATLIELMQGRNCVLLFDAVCSGARPGTLHRFEAHREPLPAAFFNISTHGVSVAEAIELARALGQLPEQVIVYGIEGGRFESGMSMLPQVKQAVPVLVNRILEEIAGLQIPNSRNSKLHKDVVPARGKREPTAPERGFPQK